ncbi:Uncharacterised protein [Mycobacterium tuberculosis]|nr:Uncharacterised protein [Mycobacterium tuberculosis]
MHLPDQYFRRLIGGQAAGVSVGEPHRVPVGKLAATFQSEAAVGDEQMQEGCAGQADRSAGPQPRAVQRGAAVMQGERCVLPGYARRDGYQAGAQQFVVYLLLLVAGSDAGCIGYYPHLHEMHRLGSRIVHFRMQDSGAGRHALGQTGIDHSAIAGGILVSERSPQHPGHDFHVTVWMGIKTRSRFHLVVVVHQQEPVVGVVGIVVVAE